MNEILKSSIKNASIFICSVILLYFLFYNLILATSFSFINIIILQKYNKEKERYNVIMENNFQINNFIKNMAINSLANNFNVLDSIEKSKNIIDDCLDYNIKVYSIPIITNWENEKEISKQIKSFAFSEKYLISTVDGVSKTIFLLKFEKNLLTIVSF